MPWTNQHLSLLVNSGKSITLACGKKAPIWNLKATRDEVLLKAWAKHFRNHYCLDTEIDVLRSGTPYSRKEYLKQIKFPDSRRAPGPSIRAGDFAEILVADFLAYTLQYWLPRTRYSDKAVRNESTKGCDIVGFKIIDESDESLQDTLAIFEAKAQLSSMTTQPRLQAAITDSVKDQLRKAESLNAIKQRLLAARDSVGMKRVERFQDLEDRPYTELYGAVAVFSEATLDKTIECGATTADHPFANSLQVLVISGKDLMALVNSLYERAANEA